MEQHKHFRYLIPPGNNFAFVRKFKYWIVASIVLMAASVSMQYLNLRTNAKLLPGGIR